MDIDDPDHGWGPVLRERAARVLEMAFIAAQLGMPSEDHETAVDTLGILLEALLADHLAPDSDLTNDRVHRRVPIGVHWQRIVTTGVTHTFVLGGGFVQPEELLAAIDERMGAPDREGRASGRRRGHGALVLRVHDDLTVLGETARSGRVAGDADAAALVDLLAWATIGAAAEAPSNADTVDPSADGADPPRGRWARDPATVAASFGIRDATLVAATREGWACDACGCFFAGRVEGTTAYPDRFAPVGRNGPCDSSTDCACHAAPVQREIR